MPASTEVVVVERRYALYKISRQETDAPFGLVKKISLEDGETPAQIRETVRLHTGSGSLYEFKPPSVLLVEHGDPNASSQLAGL